MNYLKVSLAILFLTIGISSCSQKLKSEIESKEFNSVELKPLIEKLGNQWSIGLKSKDIEVFKNLYDENAHYLPDDEIAIHGNLEIARYWKVSMDFLSDIQLEMETLEGTEDLLYETGKGIALVHNQAGGLDTLKYKYVNVWKKQKDGSYKVVIDTYNDLK